MPDEPEDLQGPSGTGGPTHDPVPPEALTTLASYLDPEGGLRVPKLTVAGEHGHPSVVLAATPHIAEVSAALPSRSGEPTEVRLFAHSGDPGDPDAEPAFGVELVAGGNYIYTLYALGQRPGGWKLSQWAEQPTPEPSPGHRS